MRRSFASARIDGSISPSDSSPEIMQSFICVYICSYIGLSPALLIIRFKLSPLSILFISDIYSIRTMHPLVNTKIERTAKIAVRS